MLDRFMIRLELRYLSDTVGLADHPAPQVSFNYLGQFTETTHNTDGLFDALPGGLGGEANMLDHTLGNDLPDAHEQVRRLINNKGFDFGDI